MTAATETPGAARASMWGTGIRRLFGRYEVVVATVGVIVLLARLAGGGFIADRIAPEDSAASVTPFVSPSAPDVHAPVDPGIALPAPAAAPFSSSPSFSGGSFSISAATSSNSDPSLGAPSAFATVAAPGGPAAIAVGRDGAVWVATDPASGPGTLLRYDAKGALRATHVLAGVTAGITAVIASPSGAVYLASRAPAAVLRFDPATGKVATVATIPDVRPCLPPVVADQCDGAVVDGAPVPAGMAFDTSGALFVADAGQGAIWRVPAGGGAIGQYTVNRDWTSPARAAGPVGLAFDGAGDLVVVVRGLLTEDKGGVYLITPGADGRPGDVKELARTADGERPTGVAVGSSGRVYLSLAGVGRVIVLGPDGTELGRSPGTDGAALDTPDGLAFIGDDLLVAIQAPGSPDNGRVVRIPAGERGGTIAAP